MYMDQKQHQHLFELMKKQRTEGLMLGIKEFIESSKFDLNVRPIYAKNLSQIEGENPLCLAVKKWNIDLIKLMLDNGANPNYQNREKSVNGGYVAVSSIFYQTYCSEDRRKQIIETMCDYGLNINIVNDSNHNLLFQATQRVCIDNSDDYTTINYLLEKGIFINHNNQGHTALTNAIAKKNTKLAIHLINNGANAENLLKKCGHTECAQEVANYYEIKKEKESLEKLVLKPSTSSKVKI